MLQTFFEYAAECAMMKLWTTILNEETMVA